MLVAFHSRRTGDGTHAGGTARGKPDHRLHQPRRDDQDLPVARVRAVLAATGKASQRQRDLPAHVVVYYVIALALYMQSSYREVLRCLLEGVQWLLDPAVALKVAGNSGISQARTRLGWDRCGSCTTRS